MLKIPLRPPRAALRLCAAVVAALATAHLLAQPTTLAFDDALRLAEQRSRQLPAQQASASAAREMAVAASRLPDPALKLGLNNLPIDGPDAFSTTRDFMTMRSVGLMQEFTSSDKRHARAARFEREAAVAEARRALALASLRRETALAWLDRLYIDRTRELLRSQRSESALQIDAAEAAYRGGRGAQADIFAARSMVARIDDRIRQMEQQGLAAQAKLSRWVGPEAALPLGAAPQLSSLAFDAGSDAVLWQRHPQVALMAEQETVALAEAEVARSSKRTDWSAELMYNQRGSSYSNMVSINFSIPLQLDQALRQDRELGAKLALAEQARELQEEALREAVADARAWAGEWRILRDRLAHYDATLNPLARERTQAAIAAYRGGGGPLAAVLEARRMEIETQLERLGVEREAAGLWARLETLLPPQVEDTAPSERTASKQEQQP